ncbi:TIGR00266 family protein [Synechococcus sp. PCC 7336]|uniref:TIGR00266 family protein n=1 Tax=Synechococcus sp. PCC 7336 TaxID=195250 RepID=UPI00034C0AD9|nr:TIGR00266 family protein [Synechococcus sp. PCC 7336]
MSTPFQVEHAPAYGMLRMQLAANQTMLVESGAMAAMDPWIDMKSKVRGGLWQGLGRVLGGESLFVSEFSTKQRSGMLFLSPGIPGDIHHYKLEGNALMVQSSGFVACDPTIELDTKFQGMRGFFSGESIFLIRACGTGDFWFSSYGAILEIPVEGEYVVDTGYVVAFEDTLDYSVEVLGGLSFKGLRTAIFGGEGLVCRFRGRGRLWVQSRHLGSLMNFLYPFRPQKNNN